MHEDQQMQHAMQNSVSPHFPTLPFYFLSPPPPLNGSTVFTVLQQERRRFIILWTVCLVFTLQRPLITLAVSCLTSLLGHPAIVFADCPGVARWHWTQHHVLFPEAWRQIYDQSNKRFDVPLTPCSMPNPRIYTVCDYWFSFAFNFTSVLPAFILIPSCWFISHNNMR